MVRHVEGVVAVRLKIIVNINEIEFENFLENTGMRNKALLSNFHGQIQIKKAFETELKRLFLNNKGEEGMKNLFGSRTMNHNLASNNFKETGFIEELEGEQLSLSHSDITPAHIGRVLAKSIYSSLNSIDGI